jgi:hypothetical protein
MNDKIEYIILKYLNKFYGDLTKHIYNNTLFFVRGKELYLELKRSGILLIDYSTIWSELTNIFGLEENETQKIIVKWLKQTYGIEISRDDLIMSETGLLDYGEYVGK